MTTVADFSVADHEYRLIFGDQPNTNSGYEHLLWRYLAAAMSWRPAKLYQGHRTEMRGWLLASESALAQGWDNPQDAQYDDL